MIDTSLFVKTLQEHGVEFFTGIPDSLLKNFCACVTDTIDESRHVSVASEGGAIGVAAGYHLATGKIPLVYMQNSGLGNAVNPLLSLADKEVCGIPMLLLIGWRGEPCTNDEPQHVKQGRIQNRLLDVMEIPYVIIDRNTANIEAVVESAVKQTKELSNPVALVVRQGTFTEYPIIYEEKWSEYYKMTREEAIETILSTIPTNAKVVATTGKTSREVFEIRKRKGESHANDFLTVGAMGHSAMIAYGMAVAIPDQMIVCLDGDGATLMQLGALPIIGASNIQNIVHIVLNNGAHDSVGGQPTIGFDMDFKTVAHYFGYGYSICCTNLHDLKKKLSEALDLGTSVLIEVCVKKGARPDLGRPTVSPLQNKQAVMENFAKKQ